MALYTITRNSKLDWNVKGNMRILQNVLNLLNTYRYEVAYDRVLGRDPSLVDKPIDKIIPSIISETYDLINEYEPRAKVVNVKVEIINGDCEVKVVVDIG